ncbi:heparin lyase I family protein [Thalassotalea fusca]
MFRKYLRGYSAFIAYCLVFGCYANDSTAINAYLMLAKKRSENLKPLREFKWTGTVNGTVSEQTRNWNRPLEEIWGVSDRYPGTQGMPIPLVRPYSQTDPGYVGPNGEQFGIEIEFGDLTVTPREPDSKNVRFYTDFGQSGAAALGMTRAEIQIRSTLQKMNINEGDTIWLGWSEYYTHLDSEKVTTIFQFRNQPNESVLAEKGFDQQTIEEIVSAGLTVGGPACGIIAIPVNGKLHFQFTTRKGTTNNWTVPLGHSYTSNFTLETNKWYDFVIQMTYSQTDNGRFRVWAFEKGENVSVASSPTWDFFGPTMYDYPDNYEFPIASPEIRLGIYRHDRMKNNESIDESDRFMTKYLGPLRIWKGNNDNGFEQVKPK